MRFTKMHGLGNDFIIIEDTEPIKAGQYSAMAIKLCNRYFGIGADGLIIIGRDPQTDIYMRIFNSDGSEPEMCGNGIRCVAKYAYESGLVQHSPISVKTLAGLRYPEVILDEAGNVASVKVDMGEPILAADDIPVKSNKEIVIGEKLSIMTKGFTFTAVSMGNPHCIIFVEDLDKTPVTEWGPAIEVHPMFPQKTNVEFVEVIGPAELRMKVWERGAGPTLACGTGTCATVVAAVLNRKSGRKCVVHLDGGDLFIEWNEANNRVYMTGPAVEVYRGEFK